MRLDPLCLTGIDNGSMINRAFAREQQSVVAGNARPTLARIIIDFASVSPASCPLHTHGEGDWGARAHVALRLDENPETKEYWE